MRLDHLLSKETSSDKKVTCNILRSEDADKMHFVIRFGRRNKAFQRGKVQLRAGIPKPRWGCSSVGRAPALQAGGRQFESVHLHHRTKSERTSGKEATPYGLIAQAVRARA